MTQRKRKRILKNMIKSARDNDKVIDFATTNQEFSLPLSLSMFPNKDSIFCEFHPSLPSFSGGASSLFSSCLRHYRRLAPPSTAAEMYATEVLGSFSVFREASSAMATTNFNRNAATIIIAAAKTNRVSTVCRCSVGSKSVGGDVFSVTPPNKYDVDYLGQSTKGDLNVKFEHLEAFGTIPCFSLIAF